MDIQKLIINQDAILIRYYYNLCNHMVTDCVEAMDARKHDEAGIKLLDFTKAETEAEEQIRYNFPG